MHKRIMSIIIFVCFIFSLFSICASAFELEEACVEIDGYYLYNFEHDIVMAQSNTDKVISASSTVKMMTACVALESDVGVNELITITEEMLKGVSGRFMGLVAGDKMTFKDLLYSMICASFNDAAHVIAFAVSGSLDDFIDRMNLKAEELGMEDTHYVDITGLSDGSKTTVNDIIKLSKYLADNEEFVKISSTKSYQLSSFATCEYNRISNRSSLLSSYRGLSNFNTGSSSGNGDSAVSYFNNGNLSFICIVMNAQSDENEETNYAEYYTRKLLNHGLYDYSQKIIFRNDLVIDSLPVQYSILNEKIDLYLANNIELYLPNDSEINNEFTYTYYLYDEELKAPLSADDEVGILIVSRNGNYVASGKLILKKDVERNVFLYIMDIMKSYITSRAFLITVISAIFFTVAYYCHRKKSLKKMYNRIPKTKKR